MAEGKKRLYKRETVEKIFNELRERVMFVNYNGHIQKVKDVIVFGSFINSDKSMVHDLDVLYVLYPRDHKNDRLERQIAANRMFERRPFSNVSYFELSYYPENEVYWYLKNKNGIISLHSGSDIKAAVYQKHVYLMKDGEYLYEPLECEGTGEKIEQTNPIEW